MRGGGDSEAGPTREKKRFMGKGPHVLNEKKEDWCHNPAREKGYTNSQKTQQGKE